VALIGDTSHELACKLSLRNPLRRSFPHEMLARGQRMAEDTLNACFGVRNPQYVMSGS